MSIFQTVVRRNKPKRNVNQISANVNFSIANTKNGRLWAWGTNPYGNLGDNTVVSNSTPVSVAGTIKTFCQISAGESFSLAIDKNGRVWAWGVNFYGQLGDNTVVSKRTPVSILGTVKTFCEIVSRAAHSLAIAKNGRLWAWGFNDKGQLGDNSVVSKSTPVSVLGTVKTFCKISVGFETNFGSGQAFNGYSYAIDKNGRLWAWGSNSRGQLGDNSVVSKSTPVSVLGTVKTFCQISAAVGNGHCSAIDKNGRAWAWGINAGGQLGDNTVVSKSTPVSVAGTVKTFCEINTGNSHVLAIDKNGKLWSWGDNSIGQLGDNSLINKSTPVSVLGAVKTFCKIAAGSGFSLAIDKNGRAWAWGSNSNGRLGINSVAYKSTPNSIIGQIKTFCKISGGNAHTLTIDKNGRVWVWGFGGQGQIGNNAIFSFISPISICGTVKTFCNIAGGPNSESLAIDKNGRLWAWGNNNAASLGDNSIVNKSTPVSVLGAVKTFCKIASGNGQSAIDKNGRAWAWGTNNFGQTGDNTVVAKSTPVSVAGTVKTFCQIAGFGNTRLAIDKNGRAWSWGGGNAGALGDNTIVNKSTPVSVAGTVKTFCQISGGNVFFAVIDKNGRAWAWGANSSGQLGDNTVVNKSTPVSVAGTVKTFCQISAALGSTHCLAIDKNGRAWAWGANDSGQLGDNTVVNKSTPVSVAGTVKTFCQISSANTFTVAIDKNGRAWGWGRADLLFGVENTTTPIQVCNI